MASQKPTLVLIHGAYHTPKHYNKLTSSLRTSGFEVHVPALLSTNESRPPNADLVTDTALVHGYVESLAEAGRVIVVLMHSYGGMVGTGALADLSLRDRRQRNQSGGVAHLVYICAHVVLEGQSMFDIVQQFNLGPLMAAAFGFSEDGGITVKDPRTLFVGNYEDETEADEYVDTLVRWNGKCLYQPLQGPCAWRTMPVSYIGASKDLAVPPDFQNLFVENIRQAGVNVDVHILDTAHLPNLTATNRLADTIIGLIERRIGS